ncbi:4Fe-4S binding protein [Candidatus Bathyarchaeota archaeon]|nr:4Fe-4S binding protein [Candidatus Bathyarchaeota archaeon]
MVMEVIGESLKLTVLAGLAIAGILVILIWKKNLTTKVTYLRFVIQVVSLVAIFYLFTYPVWQLLVLGVILIMPIVLGRFYCGWLCPFGLYMDVLTLIRKAFKMRYRNLPDKLNKILHNFRYVLLLFFLILPFILSLIEPPSTLAFGTIMALLFAGPFEPLRILLGPLIPLIVPWKGPLVISGLNFSYPYVQEVIYYSSEIFVSINALIFVALTVVGSFLVRRVWCLFCPTGSSIAIVNRFRGFKWAPVLHLNKDEEKCTKCGVCKRVCPVQVTEVYEQKGGKIMTSMCMLCLRCVEMCPYEGCLKVNMAGKTVFKSRNWLEPSKIE